MDYSLFVRLILAHLISDFILQPTKWANDKDKKGFSSKYLYWHVLVTGTVSMVLVYDWSWCIPIGIITAIHLIIDGFKGEINKRRFNYSSPKFLFFIDQIIHLVTILIVWIISTKQELLLEKAVVNLLENEKIWYYLLGYVFVSLPLAVIIGRITETWSKELENTPNVTGFQNTPHTPDSRGLKDAGRWIGIIERIIIFTFILMNQYGIIGFILAAKSVFRFGDLKDNTDHKKTEYIIIGTFLSFMLSIFTGIAINYLTN